MTDILTALNGSDWQTLSRDDVVMYFRANPESFKAHFCMTCVVGFEGILEADKKVLAITGFYELARDVFGGMKLN